MGEHCFKPSTTTPCTCPVCGKTFKLKVDLSKHMRIHTGENLYCFGDCGKSFNRKWALAAHIQIHTGEKPFNYCGKSFSQKGTLTACDVCGESFTRKSNLLIHVKHIHNRGKQDEN
uniref:C2H2-type domain-containing protein n=1 Tax=Hucho hucho TaxID=62062 RepID=A0A4W5MAW4_9TELE